MKHKSTGQNKYKTIVSLECVLLT